MAESTGNIRQIPMQGRGYFANNPPNLEKIISVKINSSIISLLTCRKKFLWF